MSGINVLNERGKDSMIQFIAFWLVFVAMVILMVKEWLTWYWGCLFMAVAVLAVYGASINDIITLTINGPSQNLSIIPLFIFGFIYARALIDTGVVETIVKKAIELGSERPFLTACILLAVWIYVSLGTQSAGVIIVGSITLPVLMALGVDGLTAALVHGAGWSAAYLMWPMTWPSVCYFTGVIPKMDATLAAQWISDHIDFMYKVLIWNVIVAYIWLVWRFKRKGYRLRSATPAEVKSEGRKVPAFAMILPAVPWALIVFAKQDPIVAFIVSIFLCYILTQPGSGRKPKDLGRLMEKNFFDGGVEAAGLILVFLAIGWLVYLPSVKAFLDPFSQSMLQFAPRDIPTFLIFFGIITFAAVFRGPGSIRMGAPIYMTLAALANQGQLGPITATAIWGAGISIWAYYLWADPTIVYTVWTTSVTGNKPIDFPKNIALWAWLMTFGGLVITVLTYII